MQLSIVKSKDTVDFDCDYTHELKTNVNYYVYNPDYPNYYMREHNCRWSARSNARIKLNCTVFDVLR